MLYESAPGAFARFWRAAVGFYCDAGPILQREVERRIKALRGEE